MGFAAQRHCNSHYYLWSHRLQTSQHIHMANPMVPVSSRPNSLQLGGSKYSQGRPPSKSYCVTTAATKSHDTLQYTQHAVEWEACMHARPHTLTWPRYRRRGSSQPSPGKYPVRRRPYGSFATARRPLSFQADTANSDGSLSYSTPRIQCSRDCQAKHTRQRGNGHLPARPRSHGSSRRSPEKTRSHPPQ
jgi:hypothetical protein